MSAPFGVGPGEIDREGQGERPIRSGSTFEFYGRDHELSAMQAAGAEP